MKGMIVSFFINAVYMPVPSRVAVTCVAVGLYDKKPSCR